MPHANSTQFIGDKFLEENKLLVMKTPSVVVQGDFNYLLNPAYELFKKIKILNADPFKFDESLFVK